MRSRKEICSQVSNNLTRNFFLRNIPVRILISHLHLWSALSGMHIFILCFLNYLMKMLMTCIDSNRSQDFMKITAKNQKDSLFRRKPSTCESESSSETRSQPPDNWSDWLLDFSVALLPLATPLFVTLLVWPFWMVPLLLLLLMLLVFSMVATEQEKKPKQLRNKVI